MKYLYYGFIKQNHICTIQEEKFNKIPLYKISRNSTFYVQLKNIC